jgi:phage gpG-like protein
MPYSAKTGYAFQYAPAVQGPNLFFDASDIDVAAEVINELANYLSVIQLPMRAAKAIASRDMVKRFREQIDPGGKPWVELSSKYERWKLKKVGVKPILTLYGDLSHQAADESAFSIVGEELFYDTSELPPYWEVHEHGSKDYGEFYHETANPDAEFAPKGESGSNIPPRPFIGLSKEASSEIFFDFDEWFGAGVDIAATKLVFSSQGVLQHRAAKGRFGPKVQL